jgi:hypothetical protein
MSEKQDIVEFLRIELANHEKSLTETEEKLKQLEQEKQFIVKLHASELEGKEAFMKDDHDGLTQKITKLTSDLQELVEFKGRKDDLERELSSLSALLANKEKEYHDEINSMERKHLQDKHVLKREMITRVTEAISSFRRVADTQMAETTKQALRENLVTTSQLRKMAAKTTELLSEIDALKEINTRFKIDTEILKDGQVQLAKKTTLYHQLIRKLLSKLNAAQVPLERDEKKWLRLVLPSAEYSDLMKNSPQSSKHDVSCSGEPKEYKISILKTDHPRQRTPLDRVEPISSDVHLKLVSLLDQYRSLTNDLVKDLERGYSHIEKANPKGVIYSSPKPKKSGGWGGRSKSPEPWSQEVDITIPRVLKVFANDLKSRRVSILFHYGKVATPNDRDNVDELPAPPVKNDEGTSPTQSNRTPLFPSKRKDVNMKMVL